MLFSLSFSASADIKWLRSSFGFLISERDPVRWLTPTLLVLNAVESFLIAFWFLLSMNPSLYIWGWGSLMWLHRYLLLWIGSIIYTNELMILTKESIIIIDGLICYDIIFLYLYILLICFDTGLGKLA